MNYKMALAAAGMLALLGTTAACGSETSSTASAADGASAPASPPAGASAAPTAATSDDFCQTLIGLDAETTPSEGATKLAAVGTPSDTTASQRHGFEVFVDGVSKLPDAATSSDFKKMEQGLSKSDQTDVQAFVAYVDKECASALASQAPASPPTN